MLPPAHPLHPPGAHLEPCAGTPHTEVSVLALLVLLPAPGPLRGQGQRGEAPGGYHHPSYGLGVPWGLSEPEVLAYMLGTHKERLALAETAPAQCLGTVEWTVPTLSLPLSLPLPPSLLPPPASAPTPTSLSAKEAASRAQEG